MILLIAAEEKILWLFIYWDMHVVDNPEWSSEEVERFQQAVVEHDKDFLKISLHVCIRWPFDALSLTSSIVAQVKCFYM